MAGVPAMLGMCAMPRMFVPVLRVFHMPRMVLRGCVLHVVCMRSMVYWRVMSSMRGVVIGVLIVRGRLIDNLLGHFRMVCMCVHFESSMGAIVALNTYNYSICTHWATEQISLEPLGQIA
jgi:hypothetical protein